LNDFGKPLGKDNEVLPTNNYGQYIADVAILPTSESGRPIVITDEQLRPLPTNSDGLYVQGLI
jgi:hypothetical protein